MRWFKSLFMLSMIFVLAACGTLQASIETQSMPDRTQAPAEVTTTEAPTTPTSPLSGTTPTDTPPEQATATAPPATAERTTQPTTPPATEQLSGVTVRKESGNPPELPNYSADNYLDDRSTPTGLILSLFNAINRREYLRAYSYWQNAGTSSQVPSFDKFEQGYQDTASVKVIFGKVGLAAGAGQAYYTVPVLLAAKTTSDAAQTFVACYTLHLAGPAIQATPPFQPLGITGADARQVANDSDVNDLLAHACNATNGIFSTLSSNPLTNTTDISPSNYLDDRSDPVLVLRSLFNAINRKEYLRAYSYWQAAGNSSQVPSFDDFQRGYADTASVELSTGIVTPDAGAGQVYYSVPVILKAKTTEDKQQTFAGCYVLHLSQPAIQATPPFEPLGIRSANVEQVANDANTAGLLANACSQQGNQTPPPPQGNTLEMAPGSTNVQVNDHVKKNGRVSYLVRAGSGQYMMVLMNSASSDLSLEVQAPSGTDLLPSSKKQTHWQSTLPASGDYILSVVSNGAAADFNLNVTIPVRVTFSPGATSASLDGQVGAKGVNTYLLRALKGQTMTVKVNSQHDDIYLTIYGLDDGEPYVRSAMQQTMASFELPSTQDYVIMLESGHASPESYSVEFIVK